jgi:hypothetical protein
MIACCPPRMRVIEDQVLIVVEMKTEKIAQIMSVLGSSRLTGYVKEYMVEKEDLV